MRRYAPCEVTSTRSHFWRLCRERTSIAVWLKQSLIDYSIIDLRLWRDDIKVIKGECPAEWNSKTSIKSAMFTRMTDITRAGLDYLAATIPTIFDAPSLISNKLNTIGQRKPDRRCALLLAPRSVARPVRGQHSKMTIFSAAMYWRSAQTSKIFEKSILFTILSFRRTRGREQHPLATSHVLYDKIC